MLDYYSVNKQASLKIDGHPGLVKLQAMCDKADKILDVGCGEGSRLHKLLPKNKIGWGIDLSAEGIKLAKSQYPQSHFQVADAQNLPFKNETFDLVYSAFAIEHCTDPRKFIDEMIRVTKKGGYVVVLCPNYGAPNRRSPVSKQNAVTKLLQGVFQDVINQSQLNWTHVTPERSFDFIDADTTVEPYAYSLKKYLVQRNIFVNTCVTLWEIEPRTKNLRKWVTQLLGAKNVWPFKYWGPQIFMIASI